MHSFRIWWTLYSSTYAAGSPFDLFSPIRHVRDDIYLESLSRFFDFWKFSFLYFFFSSSNFGLASGRATVDLENPPIQSRPEPSVRVTLPLGKWTETDGDPIFSEHWYHLEFNENSFSIWELIGKDFREKMSKYFWMRNGRRGVCGLLISRFGWLTDRKLRFGRPGRLRRVRTIRSERKFIGRISEDI